MSYYSAGGGGYYMAGFSLKKFARRAVRLVGKASSLATKASPFVTMFNPALGASLATIGGTGSRIAGMLGPFAAPSGVPAEGTPVFGELQRALSFNSPASGQVMMQAWGGGGPPGINPWAGARFRRSKRRRRY